MGEKQLATSRTCVSRRKLGIEPLEARRLLTVVYPFLEVSPNGLANEQVRDYRNAAEVVLPPLQAGLSGFNSETDMQAVLQQHAADYWSGLLGEEIVKKNPNDYWLDRLSRMEPSLLIRSGRDWAELEERSEAPKQLEATEDGFLYALKHRGIDIFDVSDPNHPQLVSSISTPEDWHSEFLLDGDRLVTIGSRSVRVFDVSDRSQPMETAAWTLQGGVRDARITEGQLLVFTESTIHLPPPEAVWNEGLDPGQSLPDSEEEVLGRFETEAEYLARVSSQLADLFLPKIAEGTREFDPNTIVLNSPATYFPPYLLPALNTSAPDAPVLDAPAPLAFEAAGDWQDLAYHAGAFTSRQTVVTMFDIDADLPVLVDTEIINGLSVESVHVGQDNIHVAGRDRERIRRFGWRWNLDGVPGQTRLASLDLGPGEIRAVALGGVEGSVVRNGGLDEHEGYLRVVTTDADLYIVDEVENRYEIVGQLLDLADGQSAFGAYFDGDRALVTTSVVIERQVIADDPLHVIDLANPSSPVELSELDIPGVVSSLHWVGDDHFAGVGFAQHDDGQWSTQVTLFDVSDLNNPSVVENWVNEDISSSWLSPARMLTTNTITFDSNTSTLLITPGQQQFDARKGTLAFRVDTRDMDEKLKFLGRLVPGRLAQRAMVIDEAIATLSDDRIALFDVNDIENRLSQHFSVEPKANDESVVVRRGEESLLDVLANEQINGPLRISAVNQSGHGATVEIAQDGQSLIYTAANDDYHEILTYTIEDRIGNMYQAQVSVHVEESQFNEVVVDYDIRITDENGDPVSDVRIGDRLWIELSADEATEQKFGIFQAIYNVQFDTDALQVVGEPEALNGYSNGFQREFNSDGFTRLGGFTGRFEPQPGRMATVRFQVEVTQAGTHQVNALPGRAFPEDDILVYSFQPQVSPDNVLPASATISVVAAEESLPEVLEPTDVDGDGFTTQIDVLRIVQHLNRREVSNREAEGEANVSRMDANEDGAVSPADVLFVVNTINDRVQVDRERQIASMQARAEGESNPLEGLDVSRIAASTAANLTQWDLERRRR